VSLFTTLLAINQPANGLKHPITNIHNSGHLVRYKGKRIIVKLNDKVVLDYAEPNPVQRNKYDEQRKLTSGTFALQGHGQKKIVEILLTNKADVNTTDKFGNTPLHVAALIGHKEVAELLFANKFKINARNSDCATFLQLAVTRDQCDLVELLFAKGADVNAKSNYNATALHFAAFLATSKW
jgi:ankyrin repeat protein